MSKNSLNDIESFVRELLTTNKFYELEVDSAQTIKGLTKIPVISKYNFNSGLNYKLINQAQDEKVIEIKETGNVSELEVYNHANYPVLIPSGSLLISKKGGWQDRVLTTDILIEANCMLRLPVACVEQYRWRPRPESEFNRIYQKLGIDESYEESDFHAMYFVSPRVTRVLMTSIDDNIEKGYSGSMRFRVNQAEVWREVEKEIEEANAKTLTKAFTEVFIKDDKKLEFDIYEGEVGDIFIGSGKILGMELYETPDIWRNICGQTIKRYKLAAKDQKDFDKRALDKFFSDLSKCEVKAKKSLGLGFDVRITKSVNGACLIIGSAQNYTPAHITIVPKEEIGERLLDSSWILQDTTNSPPGLPRMYQEVIRCFD
ncbi:MAG: DUF6569 family protein [Candidatus Aenigmatarchaeota archaeon]